MFDSFIYAVRIG